MSEQVLFLAVAVSLFAGAAQADASKVQDGQPRTAGIQRVTPEQAASPTKPAQHMAAKEAVHDPRADAPPVYLDGGHFGGE